RQAPGYEPRTPRETTLGHDGRNAQPQAVPTLGCREQCSHVATTARIRRTPTAHDHHRALILSDLDLRRCTYPVRNFSQLSGAIRTLPTMSVQLIGYARCSTDEHDLTAQRDRPAELGVEPDRIYLDHGLTGTTRARPGLDHALAAVREG